MSDVVVSSWTVVDCGSAGSASGSFCNTDGLEGLCV